MSRLQKKKSEKNERDENDFNRSSDCNLFNLIDQYWNARSLLLLCELKFDQILSMSSHRSKNVIEENDGIDIAIKNEMRLANLTFEK